ncbi:unnamed protein product [Penicillium egyptiacum]|uniref:Uncharacterized protein n=1 Tax=Penicillium egyptiacum TaxID=1303716 RepID=A0A9W4K7W5_9EURO|nr:unnamed protein product [Penicillium egyptiacum]
MPQYTVGDLIGHPSPAQLAVDTDTSISTKQWTNDYPPLHDRALTVMPPTMQALAAFLLPPEGTVAHSVGLETPAYKLNSQSLEQSTEGDVTHDFFQNISPLVELAFGDSACSIPHPSAPSTASVRGGPKLNPRALVGSDVTERKIVDYQLTMAHRKQYLEGAAIVGEFKRPRVIKRREWMFDRRPSNTTKRLMQEIRGYAYLYKCPQAFVFDSGTLVLLQFRARDAEAIRDEMCPVDICIIPREELGHGDQCTMAEGLRALALKGFTRLCATGDSVPTESGNNIRSPTKLNLAGFDRRYEFWSGRPFWVDHRTRERRSDHPSGYFRDLRFVRTRDSDRGPEFKGYWSWFDHEGHLVVDDTTNCFLS